MYSRLSNAFTPQLHISPRGILVERAYTQQDRRPTCRPGRVLRHLELPSIGIACMCKAGTDAPSFGESSKLPEHKEYASCPQCHHTSIGAHLGAVLCPPARAKDEPSARLPLTPHPRAGVFEKLVGVGQSEGPGLLAHRHIRNVSLKSGKISNVSVMYS